MFNSRFLFPIPKRMLSLEETKKQFLSNQPPKGCTFNPEKYNIDYDFEEPDYEEEDEDYEEEEEC